MASDLWFEEQLAEFFRYRRQAGDGPEFLRKYG